MVVHFYYFFCCRMNQISKQNRCFLAGNKVRSGISDFLLWNRTRHRIVCKTVQRLSHFLRRDNTYSALEALQLGAEMITFEGTLLNATELS